MINTKRIVFEVVGGILCVSIGLFGGATLTGTVDTPTPIINRAPSLSSSEKIAVVNQDAGIMKKNEMIYYFNKIVTYPSDNYEATSLEQAKSGVKNGTYAAYIIVPSTFSASVDSINGTPKKAVFDYKISSKIDSDTKDSTIREINNFEKSINTNVSYIFVNAILKEVHTLQDNASTIMKNDKKDTKSLLGVSAESLIQPIEFTKLKDEDNPIEQVDLTDEDKKMQGAVKTISTTYSDALKNGQDAYKLLVKGRDGVTGALNACSDEVKAANPLLDKNGESYTTKGLKSLSEEVEASNSQIPEKRDNLNEAITTQIKDYASENQNSINTTVKDMRENVNKLVAGMNENASSYMTSQEGKVKEFITEQNEKYNGEIKLYTKNLQQYLTKNVVSDDAEKIIKKIAQRSVSDMIGGYDSYIENQKELAAADAYNDGVKAYGDTLDKVKDKVDGFDDAIKEIEKKDTVDEEAKSKLREKYNALKSDVEGIAPVATKNPEDIEKVEKPDSEVTVELKEEDKDDLKGLVELKDAEVEPTEEDLKENPEASAKPVTEPKLDMKYAPEETYSPDDSKDAIESAIPEIKMNDVKKVETSKLETIEGFYKLPSDRFTDVIQKNLVDVIQARNTELQKNIVEKMTLFKSEEGKYQEALDGFDPFSYVESSKIETGTSDISSSMSKIVTKMNDTSRGYMTHVTDTLSKANESISTLQTDMTKANDQTKKNVVKQMDELKKVRSSNNEVNISLLKDFSGKLSFTRIGDLPNKEIYKFIINPVQCDENDK